MKNYKKPLFSVIEVNDVDIIRTSLDEVGIGESESPLEHGIPLSANAPAKDIANKE